MPGGMAGPRVLVFTYGSNQPGGRDAHRLGPLRWARPAVLPQHELFDSGLGWPFAVRGPATVHGTLVELDAEDGETRLAELDRHEGFDRTSKSHSPMLRVRLMMPDGRDRRCVWLYISTVDRVARLRPSSRPTRIPSGNWHHHRAGSTVGV